jgi:hypothetical protein
MYYKAVGVITLAYMCVGHVIFLCTRRMYQRYSGEYTSYTKPMHIRSVLRGRKKKWKTERISRFTGLFGARLEKNRCESPAHIGVSSTNWLHNLFGNKYTSRIYVYGGNMHCMSYSLHRYQLLRRLMMSAIFLKTS